MNLQSIYISCVENIGAINDLHGETGYIKSPSGGNISIANVDNWLAAEDALNKLKDIAYLENYAIQLKESVPEIFMTDDSFQVKNDTWNNIELARNSLIRSMQDVIDLYESMGLSSEDDREKQLAHNINGFNIEIPRAVNFSTYAGYVKDINLIIDQCPYLKADNEKIIFQGTDVGSMWLTFIVAIGAVGSAATVSSVILNNLASFIDKVIIIRSHKVSLDQQIENLKRTTEKNEGQKYIEDYLKKTYSELCDATFAELDEKAGITDDNDAKSRARDSAERLGKLIDEGVSIHSSLNSPDDIQVLFKPIEMKYITKKKTLRIGEKDEENNEDSEEKRKK